MTLKYSDYILDILYLAKERKDGCNLKLKYDTHELWVHKLLLWTISIRVRESVPVNSGAVTEIIIPHTENFTCYNCVCKLIETLYGRKVTEPTKSHESHLINIASFFKIIESAETYLFKTVINTLPKGKRKKIKVCGDREPKLKKNVSTSKSVSNIKFKVIKPISPKMHVCIECSYQCYRPADMVSHLTTTRHGDNVCSMCSYRADSGKKFDEHLRKHDHEKPFFCTSCEMRFSTRALWSQHQPSHSTHAPFVCPHCPKAFKWKHGLNGHLITHTKDKKHLCDECGFSTTHAKTLRAHKLTHSGDVFRCAHTGCSHTSSRKENMKIHEQTHSKKETFVCEVCGHNFTQNKNLQRHSLIHAVDKEKVYTCLHCSFQSIRSDNVKAHMQRQHTEKPLKLELCDSFVDVLSALVEGGGGRAEGIKTDSDLTVLADAASSRSRIDDSNSVQIEPVALRNFDNLIANPIVNDNDGSLSEIL